MDGYDEWRDGWAAQDAPHGTATGRHRRTQPQLGPVPEPDAGAEPEPTAQWEAQADPEAGANPRQRSRWAVSAVAGVAALLFVGQLVMASLDGGSPAHTTPTVPAFLPDPPRVDPAESPTPSGSPTASRTVSLTASPIVAPSRSASPSAATPRAPRSTTTTSAPGWPASSDPIVSYSACRASDRLYFTATFTEPYKWHQVYIDTDQDTQTGYWMGGWGADYLIEEDVLYRSGGTGWSWNEISSSGLTLSTNGGTYSWQVGTGALASPTGTIRVSFGGSDWNTQAFTPQLTVGAC